VIEGAIHRLCVTAVEKPDPVPFHVKHRRWIMLSWSVYPQGARAIYEVFHMKPWCLWITSVDNRVLCCVAHRR
jgi:hypothetical protein